MKPVFIALHLISIFILASCLSCASQTPAPSDNPDDGTGGVGLATESEPATIDPPAEDKKTSEGFMEIPMDDDSGDSSDDMSSITFEEMTRAEDLAIPDTWPEEIPVPDGYSLQNIVVNPDDSLMASFICDSTLDEIESLYINALADWEPRDPAPMPDMGLELRDFSFFKGTDTVDITAIWLEENSQSALNITWNMRTAPGQTPDRWPDYIPILPDLMIETGYNGQQGEVALSLLGTLPLDEVAAYYENHMDGWNLDLPEGMSPVFQNMLVMNYTRETEALSITGFIDEKDQKTVVMLTWMPID